MLGINGSHKRDTGEENLSGCSKNLNSAFPPIEILRFETKINRDVDVNMAHISNKFDQSVFHSF